MSSLLQLFQRGGRRSGGSSSRQTAAARRSAPDEVTAEVSKQTLRDARDFAGKMVSISGYGGSISIDYTNSWAVSTSHTYATHAHETAQLVVEQADEAKFGEGRVAFRVAGTANPGKYLTVVMYGDDVRNAIAETMARGTPLLPDLIPNVVDYVVDDCGDENFEGKGFNNRPTTVEDGPPSLLQVFELERHDGNFGIKTSFGTYWRSQHWDHTVSQSKHCMGDEQWRIHVSSYKDKRLMQEMILHRAGWNGSESRGKRL